VDTPGIPIESQLLWETSYDGSTDCGGIITVRSELGEPIHKGKRCAMVVLLFLSLPQGPPNHIHAWNIDTNLYFVWVYFIVGGNGEEDQD
jgi:hypothetical protein